jgi:hypothetical protein
VGPKSGLYAVVNGNIFVGFHVLMNVAANHDMTTCYGVHRYQVVRATRCLHLQGSCRSLRNTGNDVPHNMVSHPRKLILGSSSVSIATDYGLDGRGYIPGRGK